MYLRALEHSTRRFRAAVTLATVVDSRHRLARTQSVLGSFWNAAKRTSDPAKLPQLGNREVSTVEETVNYYLNVLKVAP